ncbi:MAG: Eco57I restriction-modification methylase domain-containing protein, partial [Trebonia sp.]
MPPRRSKPIIPNGSGFHAKPKTISQRHAEWSGLLRPDGPFIAVPVLAEAFPQYLDTIPDDTLDKLRLAWSEVSESPDTLTAAWCELVLRELLAYTPQLLAEAPGLPPGLMTGAGLKPDAILYGPDLNGGRAERLLVYRRPYDEHLTKATRQQQSPAEQAAALCRDRGVPLALLTNGAHWVLVHARPAEPATIADWDADLWSEERDLLRAFATLLRAPFVAAGRLTNLFVESANKQAEVTTTLGTQVRQAVELLVGELSRLNRESGGALLNAVPERQIYRGALTVMMRLVFLFYAEEHRLLPVDSDLYASSYSVTTLYDQLQEERNTYGDQVAGLRAAAWPRLLATFAAVYGGCEHDQMRIPPYGGGMFDPARYPWLDAVAVTDLVTAEMLKSLLVLRRRGGAAERLSYKGLDVEQIGHVYEGLLEYSCLRIEEPFVGLIGKAEPELPLSVLEAAYGRDDWDEWIAKQCDASASSLRKALDKPTVDEPTLDAACDNDKALSARVWPLRGLLRRDLRMRPTVFPAGSLIITQTGDRRATGTHYTPRPLAEEIVKYTLEPLCYNPGPADGVAPAAEHVRRADDLLNLKVLDPAMGSAAFLVSACRFLADRVVDAWDRDGYPDSVRDALGPGFDRDDALLEARRMVAARCLYGVDQDDAAVELGKLSLWLFTLAGGKPFSFLDHALRHGNSLVGLTSESQVTSFHLDPARGHQNNARLEGTIDEIAEPILARVKHLRQEIAAKPISDARMGTELSLRLAETEVLTVKLRATADAVAAAALSTAGQSDDALDDRLSLLSDDVLLMLRGTSSQSPMEEAFRTRLDTWLKGPRPEPIRPFHWPLEFPEVMDSGGFSAVVSNPPFMGGQTLTGRIGEDVREYLVNYVGRGKRGSADLCSYFLLRDLSVARAGRVGIIATNTIAQGDTREVGLDQVTADAQWTIYRANKSQPWPGTASLEVSLLWVGHAAQTETRVLDGDAVESISPSLDPKSRVPGNPYRLEVNAGQSYIGSYVLGTGFILGSSEARALITADPRNADVLFPYLNGEDLNSRPDCSARRWVINFGAMSDQEACRYQLPWDIVLKQVKPFRMENHRKVYREYWWQYAEKRPAMLEAIANLDRVLVIALVSRLVMPAMVSTGQVFSHKLGVFATDLDSDLALLSSASHSSWAWHTSSTMKADLNYSPSDVFETLVRPTATDRLSEAGKDLNTFRAGVMRRRDLGMTRLYNLIHDESERGDDIARLREIHVEIDEAVREAYALDEDRDPAIRAFEARIASAPIPSWHEIDLAHGFHDTPQGRRFTISPQARTDVLDKLLALNHYRHQQELTSGLHTKKKQRLKPSTPRRAAQDAPALGDG